MTERRTSILFAGMGFLAMLTAGFLGYRVYSMSQMPSQEELERQVRASRVVAADASQPGIDALLAMTLPDLQGTPQPLQQWSGKVLVVNYWATWCPPCVEEMPMLSRVQERFEEHGVQVVGIGMDDLDKLRIFSKEVPVKFPILVGSTEPGGNVAMTLRGMPYTVVVDRSGRVAFSTYGILKERDLESRLNELVKPRPPTHGGKG